MSKIDAIIDSILNFDPSSGEASPRQDVTEPGSAVTETPQETKDFASQPLVKPADRAKGSSDKGAFPDPAPVPTQQTAHNIAFDFNGGTRVSIPPGRWRVTLTDTERSVCLYNDEASNCMILGSKKYFIPTRIEVRCLETDQLVLSHDYDCGARDVAILLPGGTLGDAIGWFSYAVKFQEKHGCHLTIGMSPDAVKLFAGQYPGIRCCTFEDYEAERSRFYATYYIGLFFQDEAHDWQPSDFRLVGLHRTAAHILGVDDHEIPPRLNQWPVSEPPLDKPYVVIATQASSQCKYWNNPHGWTSVIQHLKGLGYEVVCIDKESVSGHRNHWNYIPHGARDETGHRPLIERAYWLKHASFFIGLSSGLSWLAWAAGTPVVMISGFTHPSNEFHTPYRVFNPHVCNSCWHDVRTPFEHGNMLFCPRHQDTPRHFECTKLIMPEQVIAYCDALHRQLASSAQQ
ncbi:autotransporter strand-loop-strand O-heptosyltransferase [Asaia krungthepensis]|uniref:Glycosyltransferase n=1 Tax=Asaia krungthepensis NRIC 0535 TaxID=1307925 RepID=A0ABQ0Q6P0_9PROT|nr:autotransporter strand-loop-strand O-heptosyltransferase [Asaia krungthepensis]GBQ93829.1 glycosyltransferase [Asaia krungthepensis NRIC 0535]